MCIYIYIYIRLEIYDFCDRELCIVVNWLCHGCTGTSTKATLNLYGLSHFIHLTQSIRAQLFHKLFDAFYTDSGISYAI